MGSTLNGRIAKLEAAMFPTSDHCRACGLRHVQPLTMDLARRIIGPISTMAPGLIASLDGPAPRLCLCEPCCGDRGDRWFARLSHGLPAEEDAA
jgi:hypothetical protein